MNTDLIVKSPLFVRQVGPEGEAVISQALEILREHLSQAQTVLSCPEHVKHFLRLLIARQTSEVFGVLWLDSSHKFLGYQKIATGTIDHASVYPREVVKAALAWNAAACIFTHNHPSGDARPSEADRKITKVLSTILEPLGVRLLDHIIVGGDHNLDTFSFIEHGLI